MYMESIMTVLRTIEESPYLAIFMESKYSFILILNVPIISVFLLFENFSALKDIDLY